MKDGVKESQNDFFAFKKLSTFEREIDPFKYIYMNTHLYESLESKII